MPASLTSELSEFALDVAQGLGGYGQKTLPPRCFYDELGSTLFEAITLLPEYGLTTADERLLENHAQDIAAFTGDLSVVAELGSGTGRKTRHILLANTPTERGVVYCPIDVSPAALARCEAELSGLACVHAVCSDWIQGLKEIAAFRTAGRAILLLFLGSSIGNVGRNDIVTFLRSIREQLREGDHLLIGADLVKAIDTMIRAYDDPTGVTAAFNLNLLGRINRELEADFDLRSFRHEVRWNHEARRVEMHLRSCSDQKVYIRGLDMALRFAEGETIWTESSHKFTLAELDHYAREAGFRPVRTWVDAEWPFAEALWKAVPI
ncbi:MAG: L-histidine N(alpha)-methyltransferase [Acidobacteriaceae bacterium]|nr:L-histidine N(alpha)-methyltransferase [Acidobacteriaceae bacterium]